MTCGDGQEIPVRVLLDLGSERAFIRNQISVSVGLSGPSEVLSVKWDQEDEKSYIQSSCKEFR